MPKIVLYVTNEIEKRYPNWGEAFANLIEEMGIETFFAESIRQKYMLVGDEDFVYEMIINNLITDELYEHCAKVRDEYIKFKNQKYITYLPASNT